MSGSREVTSNSGAIVLGLGLGGAFIGLGLFFGLRARDEARTEARLPATSGVVVESTAPGPSASTTSAVPTSPSTSAPEGAPSDARRAVEAQHAHLVEACWVPSLARSPLPAQVALTITLEYGPEGRLLIHSLQPTMNGKGGARADVTMCVNRELVLPTTVSAPGRRVRVAVPIEFP